MNRVKIDGFLYDSVGRHGRTSIRRLDIVKYIYCRGYGVHTRGQDEPVFALIKDACYILMIRQLDKAHEIIVRDLADKPSLDHRHHLNLALLHLFLTAYYLCASANVEELEAVILSESV